MIAASCPTALGALCGQLMFQLAWCHGWALSSYGDRTFAAAEPRSFVELSSVPAAYAHITYGLFRRQLKGLLFSGSMSTALSDF